MRPVRRFFWKVLWGMLLVVLLPLRGSSYDFAAAFPQTSGTLTLDGLRDRVEVLRDRHGVPHLYAHNSHDLLMAQGFVHAQDRFWQMEVTRRFASGRISEMFGRSLLGTDRFVRSLGWAQSLPQDLTASGAEVVGLLSNYADGVNAYITTQRQEKTLLGYQVLRLTNADYPPAFWQPATPLLLGKALAWGLSENLNDEIRNTRLLRSLTPAQIDELSPPYPADHPRIVQPSDPATSVPPPSPPPAPPVPAAALPLLETLSTQLNQLQPYLPVDRTGLGSNNWAIAGSRTASGNPLLANDPHLFVQMPSHWYEMGLHCLPKSEECPFEAVGFSYPGVPGVVLGHNGQIAWGVTNVAPDTMDLYVEKINPANPNEYEVNGRWVEMRQVHEQIRLPAGQSETITVRYTRHGPVVSQLFGLENFYDAQQFRDRYPLELPQQYAIALRWVANEPASIGRAILNLMKAEDWQAFRRAAEDFAYPSQNLVYADVKGNIGYQMSGKIPIRQQSDGRYPVPGWTDHYEWQEYIPFDELPTQFNPPQGYIVSANNAVVGDDYPYLISTNWDSGFRAKRIQTLIESASQPLTLEDMQTIQGDTQNLLAQALVPALLQVSLAEGRLTRAREVLRGWDFQEGTDSAAAALFEVWLKYLVQNTFADDGIATGFGSRTAEVLRRLVQQPDHAWWDNRQTPGRETRDQVFRQAIAQAVAELEDTLGPDPSRWRWGALHTVTFTEPSLGQSGFRPIERLFNRGPFETSGSTLTVNVSGWFLNQGYQVRWLPSMRMIIDLNDFEQSRSSNSTGQSGHPRHPHYDDQIESWRRLQYHPLNWRRATIEAATDQRLVLLPAG